MMRNTGFKFGDSDSDDESAKFSCDEPDETSSCAKRGSTQVPKPLTRPHTQRRIFVADKQKKNIDEFLTKIKADQSRRAEGIAPVAAPPVRAIGGPADHDDPMTTNVYVGNLPPDVDEDRLQLIFGKFGPLSSVKIMWPRTAEDRARGFNSGFVSFMHRRDAERAHDTMHGACIGDRIVHLSWGKAVPRVEEPLPCLPGQVWHCSVAYEPDETMLQGDDTLPVVVVQPPIDLDRRAEIDIAAATVAATDGEQLEKDRIKREMLAANCDDADYFRWRLHSLSQGETLTEWRTEKFSMFPGGQLWLPPSCSRPRNNPPERKRESPGSNATSPQHRRGKEQTIGTLHEVVGNKGEGVGQSEVQSLLVHLSTLDNPLPSYVNEGFEDILQALCTERESISNAMVFCIEHAANAGSLTAKIATLAMSAEATTEQRLACLYLFSDVLHNSVSVSVKGVWAYRKRFEAILEHVFIVFRNVQADAGLSPLHEFAEKVAVVLTVWTEWEIFSHEFILRLENAYYGTSLRKSEFPVESSEFAEKPPVPPSSPRKNGLEETERADAAHGRSGRLWNTLDLQRRVSNGEDSSEDDIDGIPVDTLLNSNCVAAGSAASP